MPDTLSGRLSDSRQVLQVGSSVEVEFETEGRRHGATVVECDAQGATLETSFKPQVGAVIRIGRMSAHVVARLPTAIVVEFLDIEG